MPYKHDYDRTLTRLITILSRLNDGEALSVKELAKELGVCDRTIQRDFNERLIMHYPIYQEKRRWRMSDDFKLEKTTSLEDTLVLDILGSMTLNSGEKFHKRAKKLLNKLKNGTDELFYTKIELEDITNKLEEVKLLENAIKNNQHISFIYDFESYKKELEVKPLKITNYEGFWYLVALDSRDDSLKKYYLKNITTVKLLDKKFKTDTNLQKLLENSISIWFDKDTKPYKVRLHIEKEIAKYFKRKPISKTQKITDEGDDGSLEVELFITHDMEIIPIIKYWLPHIKVIEPMRIRDKIVSDLKSF